MIQRAKMDGEETGKGDRQEGAKNVLFFFLLFVLKKKEEKKNITDQPKEKGRRQEQ